VGSGRARFKAFLVHAAQVTLPRALHSAPLSLATPCKGRPLCTVTRIASLPGGPLTRVALETRCWLMKTAQVSRGAELVCGNEGSPNASANPCPFARQMRRPILAHSRAPASRPRAWSPVVFPCATVRLKLQTRESWTDSRGQRSGMATAAEGPVAKPPSGTRKRGRNAAGVAQVATAPPEVNEFERQVRSLRQHCCSVREKGTQPSPPCLGRRQGSPACVRVG
jgi:hypothetical protein